MHFGKSGRRCKSLQCWMMSWTCVDIERGVLFLLQRVGCCHFFSLISVCRRGNETPPPAVHCRGGGLRRLCPPAFSDPWLISGAPWRDDCEPKPFWKKREKKRKKKKHPEGTKHLWRSEVFPENWSNIPIPHQRQTKQVNSTPCLM